MTTQTLIAPYLSGLNGQPGKRWEGTGQVKPWDRRVTATFAHLETPDLVGAVIGLLRLQTVPPHIIVVDTGSTQETCDQLERHRADDVEIHYIRSHGYLHSSAPVAAACDLAQALCTTEYLFLTHVDCFLRNRSYIEERLAQCDQHHPVVGYQMSPRGETDQWRGMVSHTATVLHMPTWHRLGITWSFQRTLADFDMTTSGVGWPDTETGVNLQLRALGIVPVLIGDETNYERHVDPNIDHCRSYPVSQLYLPDYHRNAQQWVDAALVEAHARIDKWSTCPTQRRT